MKNKLPITSMSAFRYEYI